MTTLSQSTKRKLSLLQLAEELGNVSKACKVMGYHRDTFYEVRRAFQVGGVAALVVKSPRFFESFRSRG
jgi:Winged helix-turn helix